MNGTYASLFAGIGGLDLAIEQCGFRCVGQVEIDPHCTRILERHWPDVPRWGDVHGFTAASYADAHGRGTANGNPGGMGGAPSRQESVQPQPRRPALPADDRHSGIATYPPSERRRRPDQSRQHAGGAATYPGGDPWRLQPVGLSGSKQAPGAVDLVCGGFPCQPASVAGRRKGTQDDRWLWPEFARVVGELRPRYVVVENVSGLLTVNGGRAFSEVLGDLASLGFDARWTCVRASDVGAPHRRERVFLVAWDSDCKGREGSGVFGSTANRRSRVASDTASHPWGEFDREPTTSVADAEDTNGRLGSERPKESPGLGRGGPGGTPTFPWGPYAPSIERWERVMGPAPHPVGDRNRLSPAFVEWMMGFPPGWVDGLNRTQALKALGNAVVPQQAVAALAPQEEE